MDRNVTVTVKAASQSDAARPLRDAQSAAQNLSAEERRYQDMLRDRRRMLDDMGRGAGGMGGMGGLGAAGLSMGTLRAMLPLAAVKGVEMGLGSIASSINALNDPLLTLNQRMEGFRESIPIIGGVFRAWRQFVESIDGTAVSLVRSAEAIRRAGVENASWSQYAAANSTAVSQREQLEAPRLAYQGAEARVQAMELPSSSSRSVTGRMDYDLAQRMLPHRREREFADADVSALNNRITLQRRRVREMEAFNQNVRNDVSNVGREMNRDVARANTVGGDGNRQNLARTSSRYLVESAELVARNNQLQSERNRLLELESQRAAAVSRARQASNAMLKEERAFLAEQAGRTQSRYEAFGGMMEGDKYFALHAAQRFKEVGFAGLAPEERAALGQAGYGDVMRMEQLKAGENDPRRQQMDQLMGVPQQSLTELERQISKLDLQINANIAIDSARVAEQLADKLGPIIDAMRTTIEEQMRLTINRDRAEQVQRQAQQR